MAVLCNLQAFIVPIIQQRHFFCLFGFFWGGKGGCPLTLAPVVLDEESQWAAREAAAFVQAG